MCGPRQIKKKKANIVVPRLSPQVIRERLEQLYGRAVDRITKPRLAALKREMGYLGALFKKNEAYLLKGLNEGDFEKRVEEIYRQYLKAKPNTELARYIKAGNRPFLVDFDSTSAVPAISVEPQWDEVERSVLLPFQELQEEVIRHMEIAIDRKVPEIYLPIGNVDPAIARQLCASINALAANNPPSGGQLRLSYSPYAIFGEGSEKEKQDWPSIKISQPPKSKKH